MIDTHGSTRALAALHQRLDEVAPELLVVVPDDDGELAPRCAALLDSLVRAVRERLARDEVWLLLVALTATYPLDDEVRAAQRHLELVDPGDAALWLLDWAHTTTAQRGSAGRHLQLVRDGVLVDVDFTAKHDLQTGIQRVVRRLVPRWHRDHAITLGVWTDHTGALRSLTADEQERTLRWVRPLRRDAADVPGEVALVPWRSTVVLPEVPGRDQCARLASLAEHSGNRLTAIAYDCIPVVSADLMPESEPVRFARYLSLVKHADVLAGISASAAAEFQGFVEALPAQGLVGPKVVACPLATDASADEAGSPPDQGDPEVLVVGSHEPRKNHLAVLHAAEVLWRQGLRFQLRFLGGSGWTTTAFDEQLQVLLDEGRAVVAERGLDDDVLWDAYRRARFTVFPSLHEGYGLPVVESLTLGTPVIGTAYGSVAELADDGGMVLVDPRDDIALTEAMRELLLDDERLAELRGKALARPVRTWDDYSRELWQMLVAER